MNEVKRWFYKDKNGEVVGHVRRYESRDLNKTSKQIIPYFNKTEQGSFERGIPDALKTVKPLYGLEHIAKYKDALYIVEGEKCAEALGSLLQEPCVTSLGGSPSARLADWKQVEALEHYVLIPDNDNAGMKYMKQVYQILQRQNPQARFTLFQLPNSEDKQDICDWLKKKEALSAWDELQPLDQVLTNEERLALCAKFKEVLKAQLYNLPQDWEVKKESKGVNCISMTDILNMDIPKSKALLSPWLTERSLSMVFAERGIGKTYFALNCAYALSTASSFLHYKAEEPVNVLYLDGEMQSYLMKERLTGISQELGATERLHIGNPDLQGDDGMPDLSTVEGQAKINTSIEEFNAKVIFVDNISTLCRSGNENEGDSWKPIQNWAIYHRSQGRSIVFIHHANKSGEQRGSSGREDVMDNVIRLRRPDDYDESKDGAKFEIHFTKARSLFGDDTKPMTASFNKDGSWSVEEHKTRREQAFDMYNQGLLQKEIAEVLGVNKSTVSKWLAGFQKAPRVSTQETAVSEA